MPWYPPCNVSYGYMQRDRYSVRCDGAPDHKGHHHNRAAGIRWSNYGGKVPRCTWVACTAPDRVHEDDGERVHYCPGGEAERELGTRQVVATAIVEGA
jgi:hypothetical protein